MIGLAPISAKWGLLNLSRPDVNVLYGGRVIIGNKYIWSVKKGIFRKRKISNIKKYYKLYTFINSKLPINKDINTRLDALSGLKAIPYFRDCSKLNVGINVNKIIREKQMENEYYKQIIGVALSLIPPICFAAIGRMAHYANLTRLPTIKETIAEVIIVIFMGVVSGGIGSYLGLSDGPILWSFISTTSFFGPRILRPLLEKASCYFFEEQDPICDMRKRKRKK